MLACGMDVDRNTCWLQLGTKNDQCKADLFLQSVAVASTGSQTFRATFDHDRGCLLMCPIHDRLVSTSSDVSEDVFGKVHLSVLTGGKVYFPMCIAMQASQCRSFEQSQVRTSSVYSDQRLELLINR